MSRKYVAAGAAGLQGGRVHPDGYPVPLSGVLAEGDDFGLSRFVGLQGAAVTIAEGQREDILGDDGLIDSIQFDPTEPPAGNLTLGVQHLELIASAKGTKIMTVDDIDIGFFQTNEPAYNDFWILLTSQAKNQDENAGTVGQPGFHNIILKSQLNGGGRDGFTTQGAASFVYQIVGSKFAKMPWGVNLTTANAGTTGAFMGAFFSRRRVSLHTFVRDGSTTTFTLDHEAAFTSIGGTMAVHNATSGTPMTQTGTPTASSEFDVTTSASVSTVTLGAAGTAGEVVVVFYEYV